MKKLIILIILSLIFTSCDSKLKPKETGYKEIVNKEEVGILGMVTEEKRIMLKQKNFIVKLLSKEKISIIET